MYLRCCLVSRIAGFFTEAKERTRQVLTESDVADRWVGLVREEITSETVVKAEELLKNLRSESPLWHRLRTELVAIREHVAQA